MKNSIKISAAGEDLLSTVDDGTNRLFINGTEISSASWTGSGTYTDTVAGHAITITQVEDTSGNVALRKTAAYTYELYKVRSNALDIYPVGSIYMSVNNTDPSTFFGGTWQQIKDTFLLSAGDTYQAGATGGEAEHTLITDEMPSHNHGYRTTDLSSGGSWTVHHYSSRALNGTLYTENAGGGKAHNNMPPYLVVYMWQRTA